MTARTVSRRLGSVLCTVCVIGSLLWMAFSHLAHRKQRTPKPHESPPAPSVPIAVNRREPLLRPSKSPEVLASIAKMKIESLSQLDRSPDESRLLWVAEEAAVASCMKARGFDYLPNPPDDDAERKVALLRMHPEDVEQARTIGYGMASAIQQGEVPKHGVDANAEHLAQMSPDRQGAFLEALRGPPIPPSDPSARDAVETVPMPAGGTAYWYRDSCFARARRGLYGDDYGHNELGFTREQLLDERGRKADGDADYVAGLQTWRTCMQKRGFEYDRSSEARAQLSRAYHEGKLTLEQLEEREIRVATADAECYVAADLGRLRSAAEGRAERDLVKQSQGMLAVMKQVRDEALGRARESVPFSSL